MKRASQVDILAGEAEAKMVSKSDMVKCPECGTKVPKNTGYCLSCDKKTVKTEAANFRAEIAALLSDTNPQTLIQRRADAEQIAENNGYTIRFMPYGEYELVSRQPDSGAVGQTTVLNTRTGDDSSGIDKALSDVAGVEGETLHNPTAKKKDWEVAEVKPMKATEGVVNAQTHANDNPPNYYDNGVVTCGQCGYQFKGKPGDDCPKCDGKAIAGGGNLDDAKAAGEGVVNKDTHANDKPPAYYDNQGITCPSCGWQGTGTAGQACPVCGGTTIAMGASKPTATPSSTLKSESDLVADLNKEFFSKYTGHIDVEEDGAIIYSDNKAQVEEIVQFIAKDMSKYGVSEVKGAFEFEDKNIWATEVTFKTVVEQILEGRSPRAIYESKCYTEVSMALVNDIQDDLNELTVFGQEIGEIDEEDASDWLELVNVLQKQRKVKVPQDSATIKFFDDVASAAGY